MLRALILALSLSLLGMAAPVWKELGAKRGAILQLVNSRGRCTAWRVSGAIFVTAGHCVTGGNAMVTIGGTSGLVLAYDPDVDLAAVFVPLGGPALKLSEDAPRLGDPIAVYGYAMGDPEPTALFGYVAHANWRPTLEKGKVREFPLLVLSTPLIPGHSGSPIFNTDLEVIGVGTATGVPGTAMAPFGFGATYEQLKAFLEPYLNE